MKTPTEKIKILYFSDWMGCEEETPKIEAIHTKLWFKTFIFGKEKFEFKHIESPSDFSEVGYDILVFDYGGIGLGCMGLVDSMTREILRLIEERPNTLYVCWTHFTHEYLKSESQKELGEYPNLITRELDNKSVIKQIKKWLKDNR